MSTLDWLLLAEIQGLGNYFVSGSDAQVKSRLQPAQEFHLLSGDFQGDRWQMRKPISLWRLRHDAALFMLQPQQPGDGLCLWKGNYLYTEFVSVLSN